MKADLHIHSVFSDGTYLPVEIVDIAKKENLDLIALTDHNTVNGIKPFAACSRYYGIKAIAGVEITTEFRGCEVHLLTYFPIDTDFGSTRYAEFTAILDRILQRKIESNRKTLDNLAKRYP